MTRHQALHALQVTIAMFEFEAVVHEDSGDAKRRTYVPHIREQAARAQAALDALEAEEYAEEEPRRTTKVLA